METQSVKNIKEYRDKIREKLVTINTAQFFNKTYGNENEYNGKSLYLGLDAILVDISYFIKSHNIFIQVSTLDERNEIINDLNYIFTYLETPQNLFAYIDNLKVKLRKYNVRNNIERWELFQDINKELLEQGN